MFGEVSQFHNYAATTAHLAHILRNSSTGRQSHHPILDWFKSNESKGPALIFDIQRIEQRMQWLNNFSRSLSITPLLAVKSCPDSQYLEAGNNYLGGFDVSNPVEYSCLPENLDGKLVSVTSPDLNTDFGIYISKGNSTVITLDSETQLNHYFRQQSPTPYVIRVQVSDLLKNTEPPDPAYFRESRFGFTIEEVKQLLEAPSLRANPPSGFHVHHGSERNQVSTFRPIINGLKILTRQQAIDAKYINLGGGWHSMNRQEISSILTEARNAFPSPCSILLEPGNWYANNAGFAICTIVNQTQSSGTIRYTVNLSSKCHLHWSEVKLIFPIKASSKKVCEVEFYGPSCYEGDRIGKFLLPYRDDFFKESGFVPGSQVVFSGVSTYSAAWNTSFNGIPKAEITWWRQPS